ncbi:MAG: FKBP-type peptidyl-prolyl cis-trans isomerase [Acidobacteriota bacterium]|jgi:peptidylprolyl isomerase
MNRHHALTVSSLLLLLAAGAALVLLGLGPAPAFAQEESMEPMAGAPAPPEHLTPPADAQTTGSGLAYKVLAEGTGTVHPDGNDLVVAHYTGWTSDGSVFDSSVVRDKPVLLPLEALIDGWTEGLMLMSEGSKWRLWIPGELAYAGIEGRPQGMLIFDVELLEVRQIPPVPDDVAAPPADAEVADSGLAWKVLEQGSGSLKPGPRSTVEVEYIGWTTDGKWFDSTYSRGDTAEFSLDGVIDGWQEGVQMMVEGEKRRFWIPQKLAYGGQEGKPKGMLVFDIKLLEIEPSETP